MKKLLTIFTFALMAITSNAQSCPDENHPHVITAYISGATYSDDQIRATMRQCHDTKGYVLDPHGACGYQAIKDLLREGEEGVFCETAHPAKFKEKVDDILGIDIAIPDRLAKMMKGKKEVVETSKDFGDFKEYLLRQ